MSEEMGGQALKLTADIARTGVEVVSSMIGGVFKASGSTVELFLRLHLAKKERQLQEKIANPLSQLKYGKNSETDLYKSGQEPCKYGSLSKDEIKKFNKYAKRWGINYSVIKSGDGSLNIIGLPSQSERVAMALKDLRDEIAKDNLLKSGFTEKDIDETFYSEYGGKGQIYEDNHYNGVSQENDIAFKYKSDDSILWENVAKECGISLSFDKKQSKRENFVSCLEDSIEQSIGADELSSNYINMPGRGLVYIDSKKNSETDKIEYRAVSVRYIDGAVEKSKLLTDAELKETQAYIQDYNNKQKAIDYRISNYGEFSEAQKAVVKRMWQGDFDYKNNQTIDYSEKFNISQIAKTNYSPKKLVALFTCMQEFNKLSQKDIDRNMAVITGDAYSAEQINALRNIAMNKGDISRIADVNLSADNYEIINDMINNENKVNDDIKLKLDNIDKYISEDIACVGSDIEVKRELVLGNNEYTFYTKNDSGVFEVSKEAVSEGEFKKIWLNELSDRMKNSETKNNIKSIELPDGDKLDLFIQQDGTYDGKINGNVIFEAVKPEQLEERVWNTFSSQHMLFDGDKKMSLYGYEIEQNGELYNVVHSINGEKKKIAENISKNEIANVVLTERKKAFDLMLTNYKAKEIQKNIDALNERNNEKSLIFKIKDAIDKGDRVSSERLMSEFYAALDGKQSSTIVETNEQTVRKENEVQKKTESYEKKENVTHISDNFIRGNNEYSKLTDTVLMSEAYKNIEQLSNNRDSYCNYLDTMSSLYDDKNGSLRYSPINTSLITLQAPEAKNVVSRSYADRMEVPDDALKVKLSYPVPYGKNADDALQEVKSGVSNIGKYNISKQDDKYTVFINTENDKQKILLERADEEQLKGFFDEVKIEKECVAYRTDYVYAVNNTGKAEYELTDKQRAALSAQIDEYKESVKGTSFERNSDAVGYAISKRYGTEAAKVNPPKDFSYKDVKVIHSEFEKLSQRCDSVLFKQNSIDLSKNLGKELTNANIVR